MHTANTLQAALIKPGSKGKGKAAKQKSQAGFSLVELMIGVAVIGVLSILMAPLVRSGVLAMEHAYDQRHRLNNQLIGNALLSFAATSGGGRLPEPYTAGTYRNAVYDPSDASADGVALSTALSQTGINLVEINDDGKAVANVRVYQLVQDLNTDIPLYFQSGPQVRLTYDFGAVYLTECSRNAACNTGIPGSTGTALSSSNFTSWTTSGTDGEPFYISSLPLQKMMLATTVQRLEKVRDAALGYLRTQQLTASGSDKTNWYPNQLGESLPGSATGAAPGSNQGCRDGWYNLDDTANLILTTIGLSHQEYGKTAWGGTIQYCRDYDPTDSQMPDEPPHYAALRMNKAVSLGIAPGAPGDNIVISF